MQLVLRFITIPQESDANLPPGEITGTVVQYSSFKQA